MRNSWLKAFVLASLMLPFATRAVANGDVANRLLNEGSAPKRLKLSQKEKSKAVKELRLALPSLTGKRRQKAAFWLASLGSGYKENRDYLIKVLRSCSNGTVECDEDTAGLVIALYRQRHHELLQALLVAGLKSDGALSEELGPFYDEVLLTSTSDFVSGLGRIDSASRNAACGLAGGGDGSGMPSQDLAIVRRHLRQLGSTSARQCLSEIERSNAVAIRAEDQK